MTLRAAGGNPRAFGLLAGLALALGLNSCAPTYREAKLVETIEQLCAQEYHFDVSARRVGRTLAIQLKHKGVLQQDENQIGLSPEANRVLGDLIEAVHRVVLSSDAPIQFYIVLVSDPAVPGAYLTLVRYLEDVRKANANMIPPTEFFSRTLLDLKFVGLPTMTLDQLVLNDIQLEQFLSWQLAKRIQSRIAESLAQHGLSNVDVGQFGGEFQDGEFAFTLNVTSKPGAELDSAVLLRIFEEATGLVAQVLSEYRFQNFQAVRLVHPSTGRSMILPKTRLEIFR